MCLNIQCTEDGAFTLMTEYVDSYYGDTHTNYIGWYYPEDGILEESFHFGDARVL